MRTQLLIFLHPLLWKADLESATEGRRWRRIVVEMKGDLQGVLKRNGSGPSPHAHASWLWLTPLRWLSPWTALAAVTTGKCWRVSQMCRRNCSLVTYQQEELPAGSYRGIEKLIIRISRKSNMLPQNRKDELRIAFRTVLINPVNKSKSSISS